MARRLRSGYTTGACAAAAAKAAAMALVDQACPSEVDIPFPDGRRANFAVCRCTLATAQATAGIIKDAGDDPDVTNGAEIVATVHFGHHGEPGGIFIGNIRLCRGPGVGMVSKPGLAVPVGEAAINPVPRQMIAAAVAEAVGDQPLTVVVSIPAGEELARRTLNHRLGILGGLSVLGTTGIVKPVSADAWTATIRACLDVAREAGLSEVVLSTGRTSERGAQRLLNLPEEAYVMMGDHLHYSLSEAAARGFQTIHLAAMWAKLIKAALAIPHTHVRHGALETGDALGLLAELGASPPLLATLAGANTAREIYFRLLAAGEETLVRAVCRRAGDYARSVTGTAVRVYLVDHRGEVLHAL